MSLQERSRTRPKGVTPPPWVQMAVRRLIGSCGEASAATRLRLAPSTLARLAAGLRVNISTLDVATMRLEVPPQSPLELTETPRRRAAR